MLFEKGIAQEIDVKTALAEYQSASNDLYWKNRKPFEGYWQQDVSYYIDAKLNDQTEIITGYEKIAYANNSPDTLHRIYFRLIQNAFQPESYKAKMEKSGKLKNSFGKYESQGLGTTVENLKINGQNKKFIIDNTILYIDLQTPLLPNEILTIEMDFQTYFDAGSMRRRMKRFDHNNFKHFDGVHWYPRLAVYDRKFKWTTDQHIGKEFYGDFGVYNVQLKLPNQYICEATGILRNKDEIYSNGLREKIDISNFQRPVKEISVPVIPDGSYKNWKWFAFNVHDFAFTTDPTYRIGEVVWNNISCIALVQEQNAYRWQPTAKFVAAVVKTYSEDIGMYAYPKMVAADAADGMEYPMITLDGGSWPSHQGLIAHEVGHNWFFGMVGNNETYRAALDEGFTQFLTAWCLKRISGNDRYPNSIEWSSVYAGFYNHVLNENTATLNVHSDHYNSVVRHGGGYSQVYYKTATMLFNLQYVLGDDLFLAAMKNYFNSWKLCHPYEEDFRSSMINYTKVDLNWFFDAWLTTNQTIDYKIKSVKKIKGKPGEYFVEIQRKGNLHMPVDFTIITKNGGRQHHIIPNTYFVKNSKTSTIHSPWISWDMLNKSRKIRVSVPEGIHEVKIDTSGRLADINRLNNSNRLHVSLNYKGAKTKFDLYKYPVKWTPAVWYNRVDGIKTGLLLEGSYLQIHHLIDLGIWYNTGWLKDNITSDFKTEFIHFSVNYKTRIGRLLDLNLKIRSLDGIKFVQTGLDKKIGEDLLRFSFKAFGMFNKGALLNEKGSSSSNPYSLYPQFFINDRINSTFNLEYLKKINYLTGNSILSVQLRNTSLFSDYSFSGLGLNLINSNPIGKKLELHSRIYAQYLHGNVAGESSIFIAGANNEDMIENKYTRSRGIIPESMIGFGKVGEYSFQYGGGLNVRGYAGYRATNSAEGDTFVIVNGNKGVSVNAELEFGKLFSNKVFNSIRFVKFLPYIFADAGILGNGSMYSGLRADAGLGTLITFKPILKTNAPLALRVDFPFVLNRVDPNSDYIDFRYVIGINRCF